MRLLLSRNMNMAQNVMREEDQEVLCILGDAVSIMHAREGNQGSAKNYRIMLAKTTLAEVGNMRHYRHDHGFDHHVEPGEWVVLRYFGCRNADDLQHVLLEALGERYAIEDGKRVYTMPLKEVLNIIREVYKARKADAESARYVRDYVMSLHFQPKPKLSVFARIRRCFKRK